LQFIEVEKYCKYYRGNFIIVSSF